MNQGHGCDYFLPTVGALLRASGFAWDGGGLGGGQVEVEIILQHFFVLFYFLLLKGTKKGKIQKKSEQQVIQYLSSK